MGVGPTGTSDSASKVLGAPGRRRADDPRGAAEGRRARRRAPAGPRVVGDRAVRSGDTRPTAIEFPIPSARALAPVEQQRVLDALHAPRFVDLAPAQVYATLLDEGTYLCAERTMYRLLAAHDEVRERRAQRQHPSYAAPELLATAPNQLWSWDISVPQQAA